MSDVPTVEFRAMANGEEAAVVALWEAAGLTRPWNDPMKDLAFARAGACSDVLVATDGGDIVASVMVGHDGHRGCVYYLAVAPEQKKQGLGKQTMSAAEAWLKDRGVWKLNLLIRGDNAAVRGFYERIGYTVEPNIQMTRRLED